MATLTDDQVLEVARAHGTTIAAHWAGLSTETVRVLRRRVDGYDRGRGRPSLVEVAMMEPRWDCPCSWCLAAREQDARRSMHRHRTTRGRLVPVDHESWRAHVLCADLPLATWFPVDDFGRWPGTANRWLYRDAINVCAACPAQTECLRFALANRVPDGVYGGLDPIDRQRMLDWLDDRDPIEHGTINGYRHRDCRCEDCGAAWSAYCREQSMRAREPERVGVA